MVVSRRMEIGQSTVQGRCRDIRRRQSIHGGEVLGRKVATQTTKGSFAAADGSGGPVARQIYLAVQLVKPMVAIKRGSLLGDSIDCSLS